jgi:hypothetical protein
MSSNFSDIADGMNDACVAAFGTVCTYTPPGGVAFAVTLILEKPIDGDMKYPGAFLVAFGVLSDFTTTPAAGGHVTVGSDTYIVFGVHKDEEGLVTLALN